jgi:hypothetical protein
MDKFQKWSLGQYDPKERDSDEDDEVPVRFQKAKDIVFSVNKRGYLILPPKDDFEKTRERQRVVRGYIGAVYSK